MSDIVHRVGIRSTPEAVYTALATPEGVAGWWTESTTGDGRAGGTLRVRFLSGGVEIGDMTMRLAELRAPERVVWEVESGPAEWLGTTIRFELKQENGVCIVLFSHQGWREQVEFMHHCSTKWAIFLMSLKSLVETGTGRPSPHDIKIDNWN